MHLRVILIAGVAAAFGAVAARAGLDVPPAPAPAPVPDMSAFARKSDIPTAGDAVPPGVSVDGAPGSSSTQYARADHTHQTSVQRAMMTLATTGQVARWTFAKPYDAGVVPIVVCTARIASGSALPFTVNTVGAPTSTYVDLVVYRVQSQVITLSALTTAALAGISVNPTAAAPVGTTVDCVAGKPTQ
ncbi:hypothetical protein [Methylobacterium tarhaniae]|uniref:hypothetical protein n=1 Tax=Methylobacterium tarhaniae TaxID=1187852 RepID=UPI003D056985